MIITTGAQDYTSEHAFTQRPSFPHWTLELTMSGSMLRKSGEMKRFHPQPNRTLILTPPDLVYSLRGEQPGWEIWTVFEPREALLPFLDWPLGEQGMPVAPLPDGAEGRRWVELLRDMDHQFSQRSAATTFLAENALERVIVEASLAETSDSTMDARISRVLERLIASPAAAHTVPDLAREASLSESRFAHLFREETGETPMAMLERLRLEQARQLLLRSDLQVQEVARDVGFEDATYFSTRFRRLYGKSPRAWRQSPG